MHNAMATGRLHARVAGALQTGSALARASAAAPGVPVVGVPGCLTFVNALYYLQEAALISFNQVFVLTSTALLAGY